MPNEAPFDPCRQWLGIDAVDLGNARLVLGISPHEADPMAVLRAADARLTLLRTISPGPFEMARAGIIKRVEEAREKLLAEIAAGPPRPRADVGAAFAMPAPPSQRGGGPPTMPPPGPSIPPAVPTAVPPVPAVPPAVPGGAFQGDGGVETIAIRTTVYRKKTPVAGIALTVLTLSAVAGGLVYYTYYGKQKAKKLGDRQTARAEQANAQAAAEPAKGRRSESVSARRAEKAPADPTSDRAVSTSKPPSKATERVRPSRRWPEPQEEPAAEEVLDAVTPPPPPMRKPEMSTPVGEKPAEEKPAEEKPVAEKPAEEKPAEGMAEADGQLDATLAEVLEALRRQEYDTVKRLLAVASKEANGREAGQRVASWQQLTTYYKGFLGYREKAMAAVKPGDEYDVKNQKVGVVEVDDDTFIYRVAGGNKTVPRDKIPAGIVLAIVMQWFDDNPANDLYLGAYHLAKPEPDVQRAREHWEKALAAGADASSLIPLLDDPVFKASE